MYIFFSVFLYKYQNLLFSQLWRNQYLVSDCFMFYSRTILAASSRVRKWHHDTPQWQRKWGREGIWRCGSFWGWTLFASCSCTPFIFMPPSLPPRRSVDKLHDSFTPVFVWWWSHQPRAILAPGTNRASDLSWHMNTLTTLCASFICYTVQVSKQ